jgi:hypothetical protein
VGSSPSPIERIEDDDDEMMMLDARSFFCFYVVGIFVLTFRKLLSNLATGRGPSSLTF